MEFFTKLIGEEYPSVKGCIKLGLAAFIASFTFNLMIDLLDLL